MIDSTITCSYKPCTHFLDGFVSLCFGSWPLDTVSLREWISWYCPLISVKWSGCLLSKWDWRFPLSLAVSWWEVSTNCTGSSTERCLYLLLRKSPAVWGLFSCLLGGCGLINVGGWGVTGRWRFLVFGCCPLLERFSSSLSTSTMSTDLYAWK